MTTLSLRFDGCTPWARPAQSGARRYNGQSKESRDAVLAIKQQIRDLDPIAGPCFLTVQLHVATKNKKNWERVKTTTPDLDNYLKFVMDVLVKAGVLKDDNVVWRVTAWKKWAPKSMTFVVIQTTNEAGNPD